MLGTLPRKCLAECLSDAGCRAGDQHALARKVGPDVPGIRAADHAAPSTGALPRGIGSSRRPICGRRPQGTTRQARQKGRMASTFPSQTSTTKIERAAGARTRPSYWNCPHASASRLEEPAARPMAGLPRLPEAQPIRIPQRRQAGRTTSKCWMNHLAQPCLALLAHRTVRPVQRQTSVLQRSQFTHVGLLSTGSATAYWLVRCGSAVFM